MRRSAVLAAAACGACAPIPLHVYVAESNPDAQVYASCTFNKHVPVGIAYPLAGTQVIVKLPTKDGRPYVELQFAVPAGYAVHLGSDQITYAWGSPQLRAIVRLPVISGVDRPIVNMNNPAMQEHMRPVLEPMRGQDFPSKTRGPNFHRNFWTATYLDGPPADDVWINLPPIAVDGKEIALPEVHFHRKLIVAVAVFNC